MHICIPDRPLGQDRDHLNNWLPSISPHPIQTGPSIPMSQLLRTPDKHLDQYVLFQVILGRQFLLLSEIDI